jgi:hypothetical protein
LTYSYAFALEVISEKPVVVPGESPGSAAGSYGVRRAGYHLGVYQIGEVNARSCVIIGTFGVIFTLKYAAS